MFVASGLLVISRLQRPNKWLAGTFHFCNSPTSGLQAHFTFATAQQAACWRISRLQQPNKPLADAFHFCSSPTSGLFTPLGHFSGKLFINTLRMDGRRAG